MLIDSRINDKLVVSIDCDAAAGEKGGGGVYGHPDKVIEQTAQIIRGIASKLGDVQTGGDGPSGVEVSFAVRVDSNAIVSVAKHADQGQFRVTMRWG